MTIACPLVMDTIEISFIFSRLKLNQIYIKKAHLNPFSFLEKTSQSYNGYEKRSRSYRRRFVALVKIIVGKPMCRNACWAPRLRPKLQTDTRAGNDPGRGPATTTGTSQRNHKRETTVGRQQQRAANDMGPAAAAGRR